MLKKHILLYIVLWLLFLPVESSFAALATKVRICSVKGTVTTQTVRSPSDSKLKCHLTRTMKVTECRVVNRSVIVETGPYGYATIEYLKWGKVKLLPNTKVVLKRDSIYINTGGSWYKVETGYVKGKATLIVRTPTCCVGIRGTEFVVNVADDGTSTFRLIEGKLEVSDLNKQKTVMLTAGMEVTVPVGSLPSIPVSSHIADNEKWWTDWPTLVPIAEMPPGGGGAAQGTARLLTASSNRDMVGRNEKFRGNGKTDAIFRAQFSAPNRMVTAVEVSNTNGVRSVWDTRPNNRLWLGGVVIGGRTMNRPDGSVNFSLGSGQNTLDFFVEDNGSIRGGKTNYRMTIFFASGDPLVMNIIPGGGGPGSSSSNTQTGTQHPLGDITKTTGTGPTGLTLDFETGRINGWTKTGTAFDHQPTYGDNPTARHRGQPSKHIGNYWIGTYEKYQGSGSQKPGSVQGDDPMGTLTSNVFTIPAGSLSFLVGGGSSPQTRIELLVSGNSVLSVSGRGTETMHRVKWDLNPWTGQQGQIRLVDNASGGWGHINADDFRFGHSSSTGLTLDFETGRTNGWTKTGTAFDHQPTYGDNPTARRRGQPSKHIGNYWVGTYEKYQGSGSQKPGSVQGDGPTGTLTSNVFTIPPGYLSFLVGGGSSSRTRVELLVSGNSVLSVSGRNTETMHRVNWDINPWAGQQGQIRLVDNASGGWGHINADDFRFSRSSSSGGTPGGIRIESATYGGNCGVAKGNVTAHIAMQCNGKSKCRYVVNHKIIGDPAFGCAKTYSVRYQCRNNPQVLEKSLQAEAGLGNQAVLLECAD